MGSILMTFVLSTSEECAAIAHDIASKVRRAVFIAARREKSNAGTGVQEVAGVDLSHSQN